MEDDDYMDTTSDNYQHDNVDNFLEDDAVDLDWALITYALNTNRLIFIGNHDWSGFHSANRENGYKYLDYTPEQLRKRFLDHVLPNIDDYELTNHERYLLYLLELNPNFKKAGKGFVPIEPTENMNIRYAGQISTDFINLDVNSIDSNDQIVVTRFEQQDSYKFKFNDVDGALISVCLNSNVVFANCELLSIPELLQNIKDAKHLFKYMRQLPENIDITVEELMQKLKMLVELKDTIMLLINKRFEN